MIQKSLSWNVTTNSPTFAYHIMSPTPVNVLIMGASGMDFHVFNTVYRGRSADFRVLGFTTAAEQNLGTTTVAEEVDVVTEVSEPAAQKGEENGSETKKNALHAAEDGKEVVDEEMDDEVDGVFAEKKGTEKAAEEKTTTGKKTVKELAAIKRSAETKKNVLHVAEDGKEAVDEEMDDDVDEVSAEKKGTKKAAEEKTTKGKKTAKELAAIKKSAAAEKKSAAAEKRNSKRAKMEEDEDSKPANVGRAYPAVLAGKGYPKGIPFYPESDLAKLVKEMKIDLVVLAYSDVAHVDVMHKASVALAAGADFQLISPKNVQLKSSKPVVSVCAVRTGVGKSSVTRAVVKFFLEKGKKVVAVREPMPYGDLARQACMRFATQQDLDENECTVEEREEYEPYVEAGMVVYAGVDYELVLRTAEKEADVVIWDGGNNEISFFQTDLLFCLADPLRPGHETKYHPGEVNARMADVFVLTKCHEAKLEDINAVEKSLLKLTNPNTPCIRLGSVTRLMDCTEKQEAELRGKTAVVLEDGPTVTHGDMAFGAGLVYANNAGIKAVDPKAFAKGSIAKIFERFSHLVHIVPAMGYTDKQLADLADTINAVPADIALNGSPSDLAKLFEKKGLKINKPMYRVGYDVAPVPGSPTTLDEILGTFAKQRKL